MVTPPFELSATATYSCTTPGYGLSPIGVNPVRTCVISDDGLEGVWDGQALSCAGIYVNNKQSLDMIMVLLVK